MITFKQSGSFANLERFLNKNKNENYASVLSKYGERGVLALMSATPVRSGLTAESWGYEIVENSGGISINWTNSNTNKGIPIAILLQYDHGTGTGGFVQGVDYINPAIQPIFDEIADGVWREVNT
jgi:hypothetical protein